MPSLARASLLPFCGSCERFVSRKYSRMLFQRRDVEPLQLRDNNALPVPPLLLPPPALVVSCSVVRLGRILLRSRKIMVVVVMVISQSTRVTRSGTRQAR